MQLRWKYFYALVCVMRTHNWLISVSSLGSACEGLKKKKWSTKYKSHRFDARNQNRHQTIKEKKIALTITIIQSDVNERTERNAKTWKNFTIKILVIFFSLFSFCSQAPTQHFFTCAFHSSIFTLSFAQNKKKS